LLGSFVLLTVRTDNAAYMLVRACNGTHSINKSAEKNIVAMELTMMGLGSIECTKCQLLDYFGAMMTVLVVSTVI